ncbi:MAG: hypothetical protein KDA49_07725 [Rhodospirillaceae bacterium]|nr:hypothetical protein [Rhodospirillaceae bacterium]MCA8932344.1 hypothetical protein [Rhodospirillaceae bacterium]
MQNRQILECDGQAVRRAGWGAKGRPIAGAILMGLAWLAAGSGAQAQCPGDRDGQYSSESCADGNQRAEFTPLDPVSGNTAGFLASFANAGLSFNMSQSGVLPFSGRRTEDGGTDRQGALPPLVGFQYGHQSTDGVESDAYTIPFRTEFDVSTTGIVAELDVPISYTEIDGAGSTFGSAGLGLRMPELWGVLTLTPQVRFGMLNSNALNAGVVGYGGSLRSFFEYEFTDLGVVDWLHVEAANLTGYYEMTDWQALQSDGMAYDTQNVVLRNGLSLTFPAEILDEDFTVTVFGTDTRIYGDASFSSWYSEAGIAFNWQDPPLPYVSRPLTLGITVRRNADGGGVLVNTGYRF